MTKSVLWDLDGTLVDSEQYHWLAWRATGSSASARTAGGKPSPLPLA